MGCTKQINIDKISKYSDMQLYIGKLNF